MAERNGTFASMFIEKLQQASSDDRILHKLCQYALGPGHQQVVSSGTRLGKRNGGTSKHLTFARRETRKLETLPSEKQNSLLLFRLSAQMSIFCLIESRLCGAIQANSIERKTMLWTIVVILLVLW